MHMGALNEFNGVRENAEAKFMLLIFAMCSRLLIKAANNKVNQIGLLHRVLNVAKVDR
jgi:hypothetical protein